MTTTTTLRTVTLTARLEDLGRGRLQFFYEISDGVSMTSISPCDRAVEEFARQLRRCLPSDPLQVPEVKGPEVSATDARSVP